MIEKRSAGSRELDAAGAALQQFDPDLQLQIPDLSAQRRLRRMQPPLGGVGEAALLGDRNEITKVAELHRRPIPIRYISSVRSLGLVGKGSPCSCPAAMACGFAAGTMEQDH